MRIVVVLMGLLIALSACTPGRVTVRVPEGEIAVEPVKQSRPRHCPPGHAKKGWC
jgi:hypothetical protein